MHTLTHMDMHMHTRHIQTHARSCGHTGFADELHQTVHLPSTPLALIKLFRENFSAAEDCLLIIYQVHHRTLNVNTQLLFFTAAQSALTAPTVIDVFIITIIAQARQSILSIFCPIFQAEILPMIIAVVG